ncbi:MAG: hypothetical protein GY804_06425 [Alphaproteobacteria bacterium]|nr:hypothetical protein [Alphaproteobacteria bacterium]
MSETNSPASGDLPKDASANNNSDAVLSGDSFNISEVLCTRFCHDLVGIVGAVANGVELLSDDNADFLNETRQLLQDSADVLAARLKFFRSTFGSGGGVVSVSDVVSVLQNYISVSGPKPSPELEWYLTDDDEEEKIDASWARFIQILSMLATDCLMRGGRVVVDKLGRESAGKAGFSVSAYGTNVKLNEDVEKIIKDGVGDISVSPKTVPVLVAQKLAGRLNGRISVSCSEEEVVFVAEF